VGAQEEFWSGEKHSAVVAEKHSAIVLAEEQNISLVRNILQLW